jgi:hypothetical protein
MRILNLNDDELVINDETLQYADYVIELEPGETIADFDKIQSLTNEEILDDSDFDEYQDDFGKEEYDEQTYTEWDEKSALDSDNIVFVCFKDLTSNLSEDDLKECAFYSTSPGGYAYEIVEREED